MRCRSPDPTPQTLKRKHLLSSRAAGHRRRERARRSSGGSCTPKGRLGRSRCLGSLVWWRSSSKRTRCFGPTERSPHLRRCGTVRGDAGEYTFIPMLVSAVSPIHPLVTRLISENSGFRGGFVWPVEGVDRRRKCARPIVDQLDQCDQLDQWGPPRRRRCA